MFAALNPRYDIESSEATYPPTPGCANQVPRGFTSGRSIAASGTGVLFVPAQPKQVNTSQGKTLIRYLFTIFSFGHGNTVRTIVIDAHLPLFANQLRALLMASTMPWCPTSYQPAPEPNILLLLSMRNQSANLETIE